MLANTHAGGRQKKWVEVINERGEAVDKEVWVEEDGTETPVHAAVPAAHAPAVKAAGESAQPLNAIQPQAAAGHAAGGADAGGGAGVGGPRAGSGGAAAAAGKAKPAATTKVGVPLTHGTQHCMVVIMCS